MTNRSPASTDRHLLPPTDYIEWHQRGVDWSASIVFPRKGYRLLQERAARILRISEGDTILRVASCTDIGENFYIQLEVEDRSLLPCWVIRKSSSCIYAHFHLHLTCEELDRFDEAYALKNSLEALLWG